MRTGCRSIAEHKWLPLSITCWAVSLSSCTAPEPPTSGIIIGISPAYLTGEAAQSLDSDGRFILSPPQPNVVEEEIGEARAEEIAVAFVSTYARYRKQEYEALHGAPIDVAVLRPCGRLVFAVTPYESLDDFVPYVARKAVGSHWLVTFCQLGQPTISVSVPALSADVEIIDGRIILPPGSGAGLHSFGIPPGFQAVPITPEAAAYRAATVTGRRVSEVPRLLLRPGLTVPQSALWLIRLESQIETRGNITGEVSSSDVIIVGHDFGWTEPKLFRFRNDSESAGVDSLRFTTDAGTSSAVPLRAKPGMPTAVETAVFQRAILP